jgi:hypothetical protein
MLGEIPADEAASILKQSSEFRSISSKLGLLKRRHLDEEEIGIPYKKELELRESEILYLFYKWHNIEEVHRIITMDWDIKRVPVGYITKFFIKHKAVIDKERLKYQDDVMGVRMAHKRSRLDELSELYRSKKGEWAETKHRADYDALLKTIDQIRREVEGERLTINGEIKVQHEIELQNHINNNILRTLNINDIIIGRLCARLKVNPKYIIYRLHTSYYAKFTGFSPVENIEEEEITYPSQIVYDFDRLAKLNEVLEAEDIPYKEVEEPANSTKLLSIKDMMLKKLQERRGLDPTK